MAKDGTIYAASIFDEGWNGNITNLTAAANPFETQENIDDDAFIPVRTSTGYIRFIIEDLSIIEEFMCNELDGRYVALTNGSGNLLWQGYVQAQTFDCQWESAPYEIEFPIVSCLGVLADMPYTPDNDFYCLGYIIKKACTNNYFDFLTWHTPVRESVNDLSAMINDKVFDKNDGEEYAAHVGYNADMEFPPDRRSCLSVIEEICRYFGWTAYERGRDIYFVSVNGTSSYEWGYWYDVTQTGLVESTGYEYASYVQLPQVMSTNNSRRFLKGYGYFEITENLASPENPINFDLSMAAPSGSTVLNGLPDCLYINYGSVNNDYIVAEEDTTGDLLAHVADYGCQLVRIKLTDEWVLFASDSQSRGDFKPAVVLKRGTTKKEAYFLALKPAIGRTFPGGIAMKATVNYYDATQQAWGNAPANTTVVMKIRWGDKWLHEVQPLEWIWSSVESYITVPITDGKLHGGAIVLYQGGGVIAAKVPKDIFYIPADSSLNGIIQVYFSVPAVSEVSHDYVVLSDIEMTAYKPNDIIINENIDYSQNLFREAGSMGGKEVKSSSNALCSEVNDKQSSDYMVMQHGLADALDTVPEIDTLQRMAQMYGTPTEQIFVDVEGVEFTPYNTIDVDGEEYFNVSVQTKWRDNKTRLQLQKIP